MSMETKHGPGQPAPQGGSHEGYERSDAEPREASETKAITQMSSK